MPFAIPDELVGLFREGRVIPFIGAGMSANVGYPSWDDLLECLGESLKRGDLTHDEIVELTGGDRLRVAEYYFLTEGKQVGPLRKEIHGQFKDISPLEFGGYVDLVNLGSQRIYTTNFDDLIERTYRELGLSYVPIATPRDLALSAGDQTEIIKYHGDLTSDPSLVLTESQYYRRLNFDSPMDLKFRADLLGKSVMFIGYSFSDINIRIIWFRLLDMMRGVDQNDLPTSYMVIVKPNPVEELLYRDAGIETVVLDPTGRAEPDTYPILVGDFLYELACRVSDPKIPGSDSPPFVSQTLLRRAESSPRDRMSRLFRHHDPEMLRLSSFRLPEGYIQKALGLFTSETRISEHSIIAAVSLYRSYPEHEELGRFLLRSLVTRVGMALQDSLDIDWDFLGEMHLEPDDKDKVFAKVREELNFHESGFDSELFFAASLLIDISAGKFGASSEEQENASQLLQRIDDLYPDAIEQLSSRGRGAIAEIADSYVPAEDIEGEDGEAPF